MGDWYRGLLKLLIVLYKLVYILVCRCVDLKINGKPKEGMVLVLGYNHVLYNVYDTHNKNNCL